MTSSIRAAPITRRPDRQLVQLVALGTAQVLAWASSTYLPAIVGTAIAAELQISRGTFFAAFSLSLVVMALVGPTVGRRIDRTMQTCAPFAFVLILDDGGVRPALLLFGGLPLAAFFALCKLRLRV